MRDMIIFFRLLKLHKVLFCVNTFRTKGKERLAREQSYLFEHSSIGSISESQILEVAMSRYDALVIIKLLLHFTASQS